MSLSISGLDIDVVTGAMRRLSSSELIGRNAVGDGMTPAPQWSRQASRL